MGQCCTAREQETAKKWATLIGWKIRRLELIGLDLIVMMGECV